MQYTGFRGKNQQIRDDAHILIPPKISENFKRELCDFMVTEAYVPMTIDDKSGNVKVVIAKHENEDRFFINMSGAFDEQAGKSLLGLSLGFNGSKFILVSTKTGAVTTGAKRKRNDVNDEQEQHHEDDLPFNIEQQQDDDDIGDNIFDDSDVALRVSRLNELLHSLNVYLLTTDMEEEFSAMQSGYRVSAMIYRKYGEYMFSRALKLLHTNTRGSYDKYKMRHTVFVGNIVAYIEAITGKDIK